MQQWNFTIERQLPAGFDLQVSYVGSKGTYLTLQQHPVNQTDDIPQSTLNSALSMYQQTGVNPLTSFVPNPFYPVITGNTNLNQPTVQRQYLAEPFPAYGSVTVFQDRAGSSNYNSLQVSARRAFAQGFTVLGSYTWSKMIDYGGSYAAQIQTGSTTGNALWAPDNERLDRSVSAFDSPHRASISFVYELPLGKGRRFLSSVPVANQIVGGWKVGGVTTFASGFPIGVSGGPGGGFNRPNVTESPVLPEKYQVTGDGHTAYPLPDGSSFVVPAGYKLYFNPHAFSVPVLIIPRAGSTGTVNVMNPYFYGTAPRLFSDLRGPGINNWDLTLSRTFSITEKIKLDARLEAYNALNRVQIGTPGGGFSNPSLVGGPGLGFNTSTAFGTINTATIQTAVGQNSNIPRYLQVSMRLYW